MFQGYNDIPRPITKEVVGQRMDGERGEGEGEGGGYGEQKEKERVRVENERTISTSFSGQKMIN